MLAASVFLIHRAISNLMNAAKVIQKLYILPVCLSLVLSSCSTGPKPAVEQTPPPNLPFKAAMAEIDITPPVGHRMAGYYDERFATGVHDPLKAKALILQQ